MSPAELRALIAAVGLTHSEFARRLGMTPRNMRRLLSGEQAITERVAADIRRMLGASDAPPPEWPRDRWIVGEGPPPARREYILHTHHPRFVARVVALDLLTDRPEPDEEPVDAAGIAYQAADNLICEISWIDPAPTDATALRHLLDQAADQLEWDAPVWL